MTRCTPTRHFVEHTCAAETQRPAVDVLTIIRKLLSQQLAHECNSVGFRHHLEDVGLYPSLRLIASHLRLGFNVTQSLERQIALNLLLGLRAIRLVSCASIPDAMSPFSLI